LKKLEHLFEYGQIEELDDRNNKLRHLKFKILEEIAYFLNPMEEIKQLYLEF